MNSPIDGYLDVSAQAVLTAIGGADGQLTIASTAGWYAGMWAWLSDGVNSAKVRVVQVVSATVLRCREEVVRGDNDGPYRSSDIRYGRGADLSAYGIGSRLDAPRQVVRVARAHGTVGSISP